MRKIIRPILLKEAITTQLGLADSQRSDRICLVFMELHFRAQQKTQARGQGKSKAILLCTSQQGQQQTIQRMNK